MTPTGSGDRPKDFSAWDVVIMTAYLVIVMVTLAITLVAAWPPPAAPSVTATPAIAVQLLFWSFSLSRDASLFLVVIAAGGIGACIHALRSFYWYVGHRSLRRSWLLMYMYLPFVGAALALIVYLLLRGGLTTASRRTVPVARQGRQQRGRLLHLHRL